jgi:hypothetical protein
MRHKNKPKRKSPKNVLRLPDLDHSRSSVLQSLGSTASKRTYGFAIDDFIGASAAFGRTVVLRYRYELEPRQLAPARLAAVRRLAYEASDSGHSPGEGCQAAWSSARELVDAQSGETTPQRAGLIVPSGSVLCSFLDIA